MNKQQAFEILYKALNIANIKGSVFTLQDATVISKALEIVQLELKVELNMQQEEEQTVPDETPEQKKKIKKAKS